MFSNRSRVVALVIFSTWPLAWADAAEPEGKARVYLRIVVFSETDGSNAAASHKQIEQQVMQLRADGARHGIEFEFRATTFVADSQKRHVTADSLARAGSELSLGFPGSKDAIVLYITGMTAGADSKGRPYLVRAPSDASMQAAIVIDSSEFGGQGCGAGNDKPCRTLALALTEVLIRRPEAVLRDAAEKMEQAIVRASQAEAN